MQEGWRPLVESWLGSGVEDPGSIEKDVAFVQPKCILLPILIHMSRVYLSALHPQRASTQPAGLHFPTTRWLALPSMVSCVPTLRSMRVDHLSGNPPVWITSAAIHPYGSPQRQSTRPVWITSITRNLASVSHATADLTPILHAQVSARADAVFHAVDRNNEGHIDEVPTLRTACARARCKAHIDVRSTDASRKRVVRNRGVPTALQVRTPLSEQSCTCLSSAFLHSSPAPDHFDAFTTVVREARWSPSFGIS